MPASIQAMQAEASAPPSVAARLRSFREALRRNRGLDTAWRVTVFALGVTLVVAWRFMHDIGFTPRSGARDCTESR